MLLKVMLYHRLREIRKSYVIGFFMCLEGPEPSSGPIESASSGLQAQACSVRNVHRETPVGVHPPLRLWHASFATYLDSGEYIGVLSVITVTLMVPFFCPYLVVSEYRFRPTITTHSIVHRSACGNWRKREPFGGASSIAR